MEQLGPDIFNDLMALKAEYQGVIGNDEPGGEDEDGWAVVVESERHGQYRQTRLEGRFFDSSEYRAILSLGEKIRRQVGEAPTIRRAERQVETKNFSTALDWLLAEARRGLTIQRYKGLGEMDADQLWETTMDSEQRRLSRVTIEDAVGYVRKCYVPSGGGFSYQPGGEPNTGRTGTGILSLEICGEHGSPEARRGGDWLLKNPLKWKGPFFYYGAYYSAQGMYQLGGNYWKQWQPISEKLLLAKQNEDGSWPAPPGATHEEQAGLIYTTAMAILSLGVEFRYLPIYQR